MKQYRKHYPECWFVVDYSHEEGDDILSRLLFTVFRIEGLDESGDNHTLDERPYASGYIKFDECAEIDFTPGLYFGSWQFVQQHFAMLTELYKEAGRIFPDMQFYLPT